MTKAKTWSIEMNAVDLRTQTADLLGRAESALVSCEEEIQRLVAEAASSSMYDEIEQLTGYARSLNEMARRVASTQRLDKLTDAGVISSTARRTEPSQPKRSTSKTDYPRFSRDGDDLVKTGWSKKKREEYVHRARRNQAESIALGLADRGRDKRVMTIDEIMTIHDSAGTEIPSYQVYLTLAWLRREGLVDRRGRNGYVVPEPDGLSEAFSDLWSTLPNHKGA
jgi:hypothetical protein